MQIKYHAKAAPSTASIHQRNALKLLRGLILRSKYFEIK